MKLTVNKLLVFLSVYVALWGLSWVCVGASLERQIFREAKHDYDEHITKPGRPPPQAPDGTFPYPSASVRTLCCPFPAIFRAEHRRVLGPLNAYGGESWFLWTPWRVYVLYTYPDSEWIS